MPRNVPTRAEQQIRAALARGALTPARAEHWRVYAAAGHDVSFIDQLAGGVVLPGMGAMPAPAGARTVAAAGPRPDPQEPDEDLAEYHTLFGSTQQGQQIADAREVAARAAVAALTDDQVYERMFGTPSPAAAPVAASAAGVAGQQGRGQAGPQRRYRLHALRASVRVPDGVAGGAGPASWRTVELRAGDLVPADAHPDDVNRLLHQKTRLGPLIKPW